MRGIGVTTNIYLRAVHMNFVLFDKINKNVKSIINMRPRLNHLLYLLSLAFFLISCEQTRVEKIGLENITGHRNFQDSIVYKPSSDTFANLRSLIYEYREIETKELKQSPFYNYYLARLYSQIDNISPYYFYDTINNFFKKKDIYEKTYDSSYYYSNKLIELQKDNIMGYYILANTMFYDRVRHLLNDKIDFPFYGNRDRSTFKNLEKLILSNAERLYSIDTSLDKSRSRMIDEVSLWFRFHNLLDEKKRTFIK
jgi:hypothetical protein